MNKNDMGTQKQPAETIGAVMKPQPLYDLCLYFLCTVFDDDKAMWRSTCEKRVADFIFLRANIPRELANTRAEEWCDLHLRDDSEEAELVPGGLECAANDLVDAAKRPIDSFIE